MRSIKNVGRCEARLGLQKKRIRLNKRLRLEITRNFSHMDTLINILLADDDIDEHIFFKEAINKINVVGHNVISVYDGVQLIDFLLKRGMYRNAKGPFPDVIIVDVNMPLMDGIQAVREIKAHKELKEIPIYMLSVSSNVTHVNTCRELGCSGYLQKQKKNDKLTKMIEAILEKEASGI